MPNVIVQENPDMLAVGRLLLFGKIRFFVSANKQDVFQTLRVSPSPGL